MNRFRQSRYMVTPVEAFRNGEAFDFDRLPDRVVKKPWKAMAFTMFLIGGFLLFLVVASYLENTYSLYAGAGLKWGRFIIFMLIITIILLITGLSMWKRVDILEINLDRIQIQRSGLLGTVMQTAEISDYRGVRPVFRYSGDSEGSGVSYWYVVLEHKDPGLSVLLFSEMQGDNNPPQEAESKPDWSNAIRRYSKQWSNDFKVPLLKEEIIYV